MARPVVVVDDANDEDTAALMAPPPAAINIRNTIAAVADRDGIVVVDDDNDDPDDDVAVGDSVDIVEERVPVTSLGIVARGCFDSRGPTMSSSMLLVLLPPNRFDVADGDDNVDGNDVIVDVLEVDTNNFDSLTALRFTPLVLDDDDDVDVDVVAERESSSSSNDRAFNNASARAAAIRRCSTLSLPSILLTLLLFNAIISLLLLSRSFVSIPSDDDGDDVDAVTGSLPVLLVLVRVLLSISSSKSLLSASVQPSG
jgi:hypothetical protein